MRKLPVLFKFKKKERLKSKIIFEQLFKEGKAINQYPLRLIWCHPEETIGNEKVQFGVAVAKRKFRKAVHRNRLKRQIKEAYRLNKQKLLTYLASGDQEVAILIIYTGKELLPYPEIEAALKGLLARWIKKHKKSVHRPTSINNESSFNEEI